MKKYRKYSIRALLLASALALGACSGSWSTTEVKTSGGEKPAATPTASVSEEQAAPSKSHAVPESERTPVSDILLTKEDITDRKYTTVADLTVTVNKTTIFHPNPTPEMVDQKLKEEASEIGADAVILVRYGTVGISFFSWGSLDGQGRAVKFVK